MNTLTERLGGLKTQQKDERGFTLVELLVVILIIGILAAIAIPAFLNQRQRANDASTESDIRNIAMTVETMLTSNANPNNIKVTTHEGGSGTLLASTVIPSTNFTKVAVDDDDVEIVIVSGDVRVTGEGDAQGYKLWATHNNGKDYNFSDDTWLLYDSNKGGLQKGAVSGDGGNTGGDEGNEEDEGGGEQEEPITSAEAEDQLEQFKSWAKSVAPNGATAASFTKSGESGVVQMKDASGAVLEERYDYNNFDPSVSSAEVAWNQAGSDQVRLTDGTSYSFDRVDEEDANADLSYEEQAEAFFNWAQANAPEGAQFVTYSYTGTVHYYTGTSTQELLGEGGPYTGFDASVEYADAFWDIFPGGTIATYDYVYHDFEF